MRASDLLETHVVDAQGRSLGRVRDIHIIQDGPLRASGQVAFRVHGLVAGPFALGTRLGYTSRQGVTSTSETRGPFPLRALFRWLHRHALYIPWEDIEAITDTHITTRRRPE
jgi:sporulation protein YlmC with PRC-barrel domain